MSQFYIDQKAAKKAGRMGKKAVCFTVATLIWNMGYGGGQEVLRVRFINQRLDRIRDVKKAKGRKRK